MKTSISPAQPYIQKASVFPLITINSVLLYLLAYVFLFLLTRMSTAISASAFNIPSLIYYFDTDFLINSHSWNAESVVAVFSAAPLISLFMALALIELYREIVQFSGIAEIFIAWLIILCMGYFAGELIIGAILNRGFGHVMKYWCIMDTGRMTFTLLSGFVLIITAKGLSRVLLCSANVYFNDLKGKLKLKFAFCQFILPFIIASLILQFCEIPKFSFYLFAARCTLVIILLPLISRSFTIPDLYFDEDPRTPSFSKSLAVITLLALLVYRVVFGIGVRIM